MLTESCLIWQVKQMVRSEEFKSMTSRVGAEAKQRRVWEVLDSAAGLPPPPLRSAYSSRSPSSRQVITIIIITIVIINQNECQPKLGACGASLCLPSRDRYYQLPMSALCPYVLPSICSPCFCGSGHQDAECPWLKLSELAF